MAFHPIDCGLLPLELRGDESHYSSRVIYAPQVQCNSDMPQICTDLRAAFLKLEFPAGFMIIIVFQIFVLLVLLAPSFLQAFQKGGVKKQGNALINLAIFNFELTS